MPNRRISDLPAISSVDIDDDDLFTIVHVAEVDPGLKNKKFTFLEHRKYLDNYYIAASGGTIGPLTITGNLSVTGSVTVTDNLSVQGTGTFGEINVNDFVSTGTISGNTITGESILGTNVNAITGYIVNCQIVNCTGDSFRITNLSGASITGDSIRASGITGQSITSDNVNAISLSSTTISGSTYIANGTTFVSGAGDVRPRGLFSFPQTAGTSGYTLTSLGNGQTVWGVPTTTGIILSTVVAETKIQITEAYVITSGYNAMSQGPVEIVSGVTFTIPSGSIWRIFD